MKRHTSLSLGFVTPAYSPVERQHRRGDSHRTVQHAPDHQWWKPVVTSPNMQYPTLTADQRNRALYG